VRWLVGLLLVWAAVSKLANLQDFYGGLLAYRLPLPDFFLRAVAACLPWLELLCGLMLLAQVRTEAGLVWALLLFSIFVLATGQAWVRGLDISCGCFNLQWLGLGENEGIGRFLHSVQFAFFRALLLTVGAVYLLRGPPQAASVS
jgi:putative oxidoreductase